MEDREKLEILDELILEAYVISKAQLNALKLHEEQYYFTGMSYLSVLLCDKFKKI